MAIIEQAQLLEMIDTVSITQSQYTVDGGSARATFIIDWKDFYAFALSILGGSYFDVNYKLKRILPLSLPEAPWLYADRITAFQGIGMDGRANTDTFANFDAFFALDKNVFEYAGVYQKYKITVQFTSRPYRIMSDDDLAFFGVVNRDNWFIDKIQNNQITEQNIPFQDTFEYLRYLVVSEEPKTEVLTNSLSAWYYKLNNKQDATGPDNNFAITTTDGGGSNITQNKGTVKVKWYYLPYQIVNNINFFNGYNKLNQQPFLGYPAGSLLFKNIEINSYSSPYPIDNITIGNTVDTILTSYLKNRYCDLTFVFEKFIVPADQLGTLPTNNYRPLNGKIRAGVNLQPFSGNNKYYYVENRDQSNSNLALPVHWSYDFRNLFNYYPYIQP